ncbi:carboxypeptidase-like regulatory domain-containing protein, partial [uncultured Aquimarina sp.]|uniref:carboxypeptidase-like regulatory domain-containing protein n=1 Tax=uncultured Aquimarina sp. TaxID=575652 RepID=UPI00260386E7
MNHKITIALLLSLLYHFTSYGQESYELTGIVTSIETNTPIPGVSVLVVGTSTGAVTDFDGKYTINVKSGDVVQFSYVGLTTKNVTISGQTTLNVSMEEDSESLEEIVVIGYGSQKKSDVTGSVSSVNSEELNAFPVLNAAQALQGRAAGVVVQSNNGGEPG